MVHHWCEADLDGLCYYQLVTYVLVDGSAVFML